MSHRIPAPPTPNPGTTTLLAHGPKTVPARHGSAHDSAFIPTPAASSLGTPGACPIQQPGFFPWNRVPKSTPELHSNGGVWLVEMQACVCAHCHHRPVFD